MSGGGRAGYALRTLPGARKPSCAAGGLGR